MLTTVPQSYINFARLATFITLRRRCRPLSRREEANRAQRVIVRGNIFGFYSVQLVVVGYLVCDEREVCEAPILA